MTTVSYDDFAKLDLRVAKIIATESIEGKSRIIKGRIDLGGDDQRDVIIGGAQYFQPDDIVGKTVIVLAIKKIEIFGAIFLADNNASGIDKTIAINVPSIAISIVSIIDNINDLKSEKSGGSILDIMSPK